MSSFLWCNAAPPLQAAVLAAMMAEWKPFESETMLLQTDSGLEKLTRKHRSAFDEIPSTRVFVLHNAETPLLNGQSLAALRALLVLQTQNGFQTRTLVYPIHSTFGEHSRMGTLVLAAAGTVVPLPMVVWPASSTVNFFAKSGWHVPESFTEEDNMGGGLVRKSDATSDAKMAELIAHVDTWLQIRG